MRTSSNRMAWTLLALTLIGAGSVAAATHRIFEIHPSIGIARVGDSTTEHYLAPDAWERDFVPPGGYRDASPEKRIKRMGVRFRIYELDAAGNVIGEITSTTEPDAEIIWRVHLVNKKAAKDEPSGSGTPLNQEDPATMTIDPGVLTIGPNEAHVVNGFIGPPPNPIPVKLGDLSTTPEGWLIVLGGHGVAASWNSSPLSANNVLHNPGWFDDTSDGPVRATIRFTALGGTVEEFEARSAWVVVAPPDYAHPVMNLVTLYDLVRDRSVKPDLSAPASEEELVSFKRDVYPILRRVPHLQWTIMSQQATKFGRTAMHAHGIPGD